MISRATMTISPDGYWPKGMDASAQFRSMDDFMRAIYPIWKGIEKKDKEAETALTGEQVRVPGQVLFECLTMHRQDRAIHQSGHKPIKDNTPPADFRKKAAASDKFSSWRGE